MTKLKFSEAIFEFNIPHPDNENALFSAHWFTNKSSYEPKRKYEVDIFSGGTYKVSYYTDHRICEKNSIEFIKKYLYENPD
jgi:hypothetical protein